MPTPTRASRTHVTLTVRHPALTFAHAIPRHWLADNAYATHLFNGANLLFPEGERYFIRAVHDEACRQGVESRSDVRGFAGQEGVHAAVHEHYFRSMRAQGYRIDGFLRVFRSHVRFWQRVLPASLRLSITAGSEHWTSTMAAFVLAEEGLLRRTHSTMRRLVVWHAVEELEHKAVAFDLLRERHPRGYVLRMIGFIIASANIVGWTLAGARMLHRQDGSGRKETARQVSRFREEAQGDLGRTIRSAVASYFRPSFHPDERDDRALIAARLAEIGPMQGSPERVGQTRLH